MESKIACAGFMMLSESGALDNKDMIITTHLYMSHHTTLLVPTTWECLTTLSLRECHAVIRLDAIPSLESLRVHDCSVLEVINGIFPVLKTLDLDHNLALNALHVSVPRLTDLTLNRCAALAIIPASMTSQLQKYASSTMTIEILQHVPTSLRELSIRNCNQSLEHLVGLERLDLDWCSQLVILDWIECLPNLRRLKISSCQRMKRFSVPKSLELLTVCNCNAVANLPFGLVFCDNLELIFLEDCDLLNRSLQLEGHILGDNLSCVISQLWGIRTSAVPRLF
jgi:hypothetical protein